MNSPRTSRVLQLLSLVATNPEPTRLKDISAALGVHPSMVSRMVADLIDGGFLAKSAYRSVTATPLLAVLGRHAGENHPLTRIARQELHSRVEELKYSCEFATVTPCGLFHFYKRTFGTPAAPPLWRSDLAAVIFAARQTPWEECLAILRSTMPSETDFPRFRERVEEAAQNPFLLNYHSGRYWQLTLPVRCGETMCALSLAGTAATDMTQIQFELSRLSARIREVFNSRGYGNA